MIFLQIVVAVAATMILINTLITINRMSPKTHHGIRAAFALMATGAFGELAAIFSGHSPGIAESLFVSGFGLLDFIDRRGITRCPHIRLEDKPEGCR